MSTALPVSRGTYLVDVIRHSRVLDAALILSGAAFIVLAARITIPLGFTPVPITLSTFAVMVNGAVLGSWRGASSALLYLVIGALGAPVFSAGQSGVSFPTFGYIVGFVVAALVVGQLARREADRKVGTTLLLGGIGTIVIYAFGVPWLAVSLGVDLGRAVLLGVVPFLVGDALKIVVLSALLPTAWKAVALLVAPTSKPRQ
ncbi:biotin transporter BioY [Microbacterium sp. VKM Ac-2870]|uniref:biotin transporter BioY n=1 Tax=Microbacterium sp. VKM Ac-2870 TaxID=2783825 RepID=UPI00188D3AEE|nr:biotin transporter BioY [Microbacterium sp. VKM Ac-2870]MBF4562225.1 biotin transporter BioY [Microbacterium sp. VKM Ac-2870]